MADEKLATIHTLSNRFEADLLIDALEKEGIPALVRPFEETPYAMLFVAQKGWGLVQVPREFAPRAREVIAPLIESLESGGENLYVEPAGVDPALWEALRSAEPKAICENAMVQYAGGIYRFRFLNARLACDPANEQIRFEAEESPFLRLDFELHLVALHYLLEAQGLGLSGQWVSEKDIPGGGLFFRGPHRFPFEPLLERFGSRRDLFAAAAERLGGSDVPMGDCAYRLWPLPQVPLILVLWEGDDEFEPSLRVRFDATVTAHLRALDTLWAMVNVVCRTLRRAAREES